MIETRAAASSRVTGELGQQEMRSRATVSSCGSFVMLLFTKMEQEMGHMHIWTAPIFLLDFV